MIEILALIGFSLGYSVNLYQKESVEIDTLCLLVIQHGDNRRFLTFESEDIRSSHQKATDYLRRLEEGEGYDMATITYDGYITRDGNREEALISQVFTLNSYADRRFGQIYLRKDGKLELEGKPFSGGDWNFSTLNAADAQEIVFQSMLQEIEH